MHWFLATVALWMAADAALPSAGETQSYVLDEASSRITAVVPLLGVAGTTITFPKMQGSVTYATPEDLQFEITLDTRVITAHDSKIQAEVRGPRFFDVATYPTLRFVSRTYRPVSPLTGDLTGELTIKGITRPMTLQVAFAQPPLQKPANAPLDLTALMTINRRDFGMTALPLLVGRKVDVTIKARLLPRS